ncbi:hypothetical protein AB0A74_03170 [Saccharothrix sp. NPDC042600]|uniref:hypothetical protein n=1 Tax=Saccharothrix TaxID=2071 RepID=UPI0033F3CB5C|nr:hypothetical protein GCM10017745_67780 [Saccharothrix mutabilis subsp. capreolus]
MTDANKKLDQLVQAARMSSDLDAVEHLSGVADHIAHRLSETFGRDDWELFVRYAEAATYHPSPDSVRLISEAFVSLHRGNVDSKLYYQEWLARVMVDLADPGTMSVICEILWSGVPAWDSSLARTCVDALCSIGTAEAISMLRRVVVLHTLEVRSRALEEFDLMTAEEDVDTEFFVGLLSHRLGRNLYRGAAGWMSLLIDAVVVAPERSPWAGPLTDLITRSYALASSLDAPLRLEVVFVVADDRWPSPISEVTVGVHSESSVGSTAVVGVPIPEVPPSMPGEFLKDQLKLAVEMVHLSLAASNSGQLLDEHREVVARL